MGGMSLRRRGQQRRMGQQAQREAGRASCDFQIAIGAGEMVALSDLGRSIGDPRPGVNVGRGCRISGFESGVEYQV